MTDKDQNVQTEQPNKSCDHVYALPGDKPPPQLRWSRRHSTEGHAVSSGNRPCFGSLVLVTHRPINCVRELVQGVVFFGQFQNGLSGKKLRGVVAGSPQWLQQFSLDEDHDGIGLTVQYLRDLLGGKPEGESDMAEDIGSLHVPKNSVPAFLEPFGQGQCELHPVASVSTTPQFREAHRQPC